ncbi:MAG: 4Fe-4S ferredoxin [candidate division WOR-3 bacterium]
MNKVDELRKRARELLESKAVKVFLGYKRSSQPGLSSPIFITRPEDAEQLIFDFSCSQNLTNYLLKLKVEESKPEGLPYIRGDSREPRGKIGVVARGCDSRSIVILLQEKQVERESLYILGVGCEGVIENGEKSPSCRSCLYPNPVIYDEMVGEKVEPSPELVEDEFDNLSFDERWQILSEEISRCIRCYACRQVCPNCYCPVCFVDASMPQLLGKTHSLSDNMVFHIGRALHMAGRCVECGACHRACPMGIDLMRFNRKVARIVKERFGAVAGVDLNQPPALTQYQPEDPQEFIK